MTNASHVPPPRALTQAFADDPRASYQAVRSATSALTAGLSPEDMQIQSMPDASPVKWHLAHTAWFFETFVLRPHVPRYRPLDERYAALFNSYYVSVGPAHPRPSRGVLSRPGLTDVLTFRAHVDDAIDRALAAGTLPPAVLAIVELGLHHEQQHQELILTDLLHAFACNQIAPVYREQPTRPPVATTPLRWLPYDGGVVEIGHDGRGFAFDNEGPRHRAFLQPFALASRLVTNGEFLAFVEDGGYRRPELWLSIGYDTVMTHVWDAPAYWRATGDGFEEFTLAGQRPLELAAPVTHVSYFEADAYARWADARLPTEQEWESIAAGVPVVGNFVEVGGLHPCPVTDCDTASSLPAQLFGDAWEWTASAYGGYPGYRAPAGALGEYNGKFMCNQFVLRGGSCVTPGSHVRPTYRNFFDPAARWQFSGIRLVRDP
jgi:ergothioneine biosynthesis protein EgtB